MRSLRGAQLVVAGASLFLVGSSSAQRKEARAVRAELSRDGQLRLEGDVRLKLGACELTANELRLARGELSGSQVCLRSAGLDLRSHRLVLDRDTVRARWLSVAVCGCGAAPALRIRARSAWTSADGGRLHLRGPTVRLGPLPIFAAPYWALPLKPAQSGLLLPRVGYSQRDGLRLEQGGYLAMPGGRADLLAAASWHQGRGFGGRLRGRYFTKQRGDGVLWLQGLHDSSEREAAYRGSLRGHLVLRGDSWQLAGLPDLVSDERLLADLAAEPGRVFAPYLRSRLYGVAWGGPFSVVAIGDLFQDLSTALEHRSESVHGAGALRIDLAPTPLVGPLLLLATVEAAAVSSTPIEDHPAANEQNASTDGITLSPALAIARPIGPLQLEALARYRLGVVRHQQEATAQHGASFSSELSLPLARRYSAVVHRIAPFAGWRAAVGEARPRTVGRRIGARQGGYAVSGLRTRLDGQTLRGQVSLLAALGLDERVDGAARVRLSSRYSALLARWSWRLSEPGAVTFFDGELCLGPSLLRLCGGYLWRQLDELAGVITPSPPSWTDGGDLETFVTQQRLDPRAAEQARGALRMQIGPTISAQFEIAVDPQRAELAYGLYRLDARFGCGCYRVSAVGRSRQGQRWPDVMVQLSLSPPPLRCSPSNSPEPLL